MKYMILHADGMADIPCSELGGQTPLEAAATPHLDRIAQSSEVGVLGFPSDNGPAGSDVTSVAVLGYDPKKYYPGAGPLEAAGLGITVGEQDVVFRCTMVTVRGEGGPHHLEWLSLSSVDVKYQWLYRHLSIHARSKCRPP